MSKTVSMSPVRTLEKRASKLGADKALAAPSLKEMLAAMKGAPTTNRWDVVTSYSEDKLNQVLKSQYDADKLLTEVVIHTEGVDPLTDNKFPLVVTLELGAPLMQFVPGQSGWAKLTIPVDSGNYKIAKKDPKPIPDNVYNLEVTVPLAALDGSTGKVDHGGDVIAFVEGKEEQKHIILHFNNSAQSTYKLQKKDDQPRPIDDILNVYVLPKLKAYFAENVDQVEYALTSVSNKKPHGDVILQPKSFVFASAGGSDNGVLSLYIQTDGSGNQPGNLHPSFQPGHVEMLPVPKGHTASVIFSYDLIATCYVKKQLEAAGFHVSLDNSAEGIALTVAVDKSIIKNASHGNFWGSFNVDGIDASLKKDPIKLVIKDGKMSVSWSFKQTLGWNRIIPMAKTVPWGKVDLKMSMNKTVPFSLSDEVASANLHITSADYHISTEAQSLPWYDHLIGGQNSLPSELEADNLSLSLPAIDLNLGGLGFFPITNLLFPGQHVIDIDKSTGIEMPHDFLLTGQIATGNPKALVSANYLLEMASTNTLQSTPQTKGASALLHDVTTQDKVAAQVLDLVADGDRDKLQGWLDKNGYEVTGDQIQASVQALSSGQGDDISIWGGVYEVEAPQRFEDKKLTVFTKSQRVELDGKKVDYTVEASNKIRWQNTAGETFEITFLDHFDDQGRPAANTFEGTITTPASKPKAKPTVVDFKGTMVVFEEEEHWHELAETEQAVMVIALIGSISGVLIGIAGLLKGTKAGNAISESFNKGREKLRERARERAIDAADPDAEMWDEATADLDREARQEINRELTKNRRNYKDLDVNEIAENLPDSVTEAFEARFKERFWEVARSRIEAELGGISKLIDVDSYKEQVLEQYADAKIDAMLDGADGYFESVKRATAAEFKAEIFRRDYEAKAREVQEATMARDATGSEIESRQDRVDEIEEQLDDESLPDDTREELEREKAELEQEISDKQDELDQQEDDLADKEEARDEAEQNKEDAENEQHDAERQAEERRAEVFGE
ncbi:hypothetical protein FIV42_19925 [Persicimonas caeni]|uniref:Uncharacterized protein n=1 Tax=Persicimonas caeni TaxID=2292766 RepID=A0A4Y6PY49_PERCE|nr:hypothetical protein [Persicimonas caeni]QDG52927.1 hypothetical protein FIV42_19925 [Persicimonas caeni]QED34149.1 hypothetical protein FRD00_19920 [Persicimonas caeni]